MLHKTFTFLGRRHTEESRMKISESLKKRPRVFYRCGGKPGRSCPGSGNYRSRLGQTYIDWLKQNLCIHCQKTCIKGLYKCPDCHLKVRIVPHNRRSKRILFETRRRLIKRAQEEAAALLRLNKWESPPACVSSK